MSEMNFAKILDAITLMDLAAPDPRSSRMKRKKCLVIMNTI
jgi:hypothetical protein